MIIPFERHSHPGVVPRAPQRKYGHDRGGRAGDDLAVIEDTVLVDFGSPGKLSFLPKRLVDNDAGRPAAGPTCGRNAA